MSAATQRNRSSASWSLEDVARLSEGKLEFGSVSGSPRSVNEDAAQRKFDYQQISSDSRTIGEGDFFVALRGELHDGHDHAAASAEAGAVGLFVDRPIAADCAQVRVENTTVGWQTWSANHRSEWGPKPVIGVTGSSGKTTVKDIVAHLLTGLGNVWATQGNLNNHFGVPWTLLGLAPEHDYAVVEMGMNHPGEIETLTQLASPDVAVITSIGRAHVGLMGSREAILSAKLEIVRGLPDDAPLVLPADPWVQQRLPDEVRSRRCITFGLEPSADWHPEGNVEFTVRGARYQTSRGPRVDLSLLGEGSVLSSLAALATIDALGLDVEALSGRLRTVRRQPMRMEPRWIGGALWLLDCYNASPESSKLAIEFLQRVPFEGRRVLVLGELSELGDETESIHQELGEAARGLDAVYLVGPALRPVYETLQREKTGIPGVGHVEWSAMREEASIQLSEGIQEGDLVLLKASRRLALERILERFTPGPLSSGDN